MTAPGFFLRHVAALVDRRSPGASRISTRQFGVDEGSPDSTEKSFGYGAPILVTFRDCDGIDRALVIHTAGSNDFGHDRRSDRVGELLLGFDTFATIPSHVEPLEVGFVGEKGHFVPLNDGGECYLLTEFAPGEIYADDLRTIASSKVATDRDLLRLDRLVDCMVEIHSQKVGRKAVYRRAIRDLIGRGDGIYGLVDDFGDDVPAAPADRLANIERLSAQWRWKLRGKENRLSRTHGDLHPFNIVFGSNNNENNKDDNKLSLLDAARGCHGDPADDVCCLALNYVFFAFEHPGAWRGGLSTLWYRLWDRYLEKTGDHELLDAAPPFVAWRALVMADPRWYPAVSSDSRDALLSLVENALEAGRFDPSSVEELY